MDTRSFFERLPSLIPERSAVFERNTKTVCVIVHGVGAWIIRFGDAKAENAIEDGIDFDADLVATWSEAQFDELLGGNPDPESVVPITLGDPSLLGQLGTLLMPPARGGLGARMMF